MICVINIAYYMPNLLKRLISLVKVNGYVFKYKPMPYVYNITL